MLVRLLYTLAMSNLNATIATEPDTYNHGSGRQRRAQPQNQEGHTASCMPPLHLMSSALASRGRVRVDITPSHGAQLVSRPTCSLAASTRRSGRSLAACSASLVTSPSRYCAAASSPSVPTCGSGQQGRQGNSSSPHRICRGRAAPPSGWTWPGKPRSSACCLPPTLRGSGSCRGRAPVEAISHQHRSSSSSRPGGGQCLSSGARCVRVRGPQKRGPVAQTLPAAPAPCQRP